MLGVNRVKTQLELESSVSELNNELETRVGNLKEEVSGLVYENIMSMQIKRI